MMHRPLLISSLSREVAGDLHRSPLGTMSKLKMRHRNLSDVDQLAVKARQGRSAFDVELKTVDKNGSRVAARKSSTLGATGKMQKHKLRERFAAHRLPN